VLVEIFAADGTLLDSRTATSAQAMVGFDDDFAQPAKSVTFRARTSLRGAVEIGGVGAGSWTIALGNRAKTFNLADVGGIGAVMLAPPAEVSVFEVSDSDDEIVATVHLETADDPSNPLAGVGAFSLTVRPVPAPPKRGAGRRRSGSRCRGCRSRGRWTHRGAGDRGRRQVHHRRTR